MDSYIHDDLHYNSTSSVEVFVIENNLNGVTTINYTKVVLPKTEEGLTVITSAVKEHLKIKGSFKVYDCNGSEIYAEDYWNLSDND